MWIIQLYLTCDGWFSKVFLYHMRFLVDLVGFNKMNLPPFYLQQILIKMVACARKMMVLQPHDVYHHNLIQIFYLHQLNKKTQ